jgi:hypothetical protein
MQFVGTLLKRSALSKFVQCIVIFLRRELVALTVFVHVYALAVRLARTRQITYFVNTLWPSCLYFVRFVLALCTPLHIYITYYV